MTDAIDELYRIWASDPYAICPELWVKPDRDDEYWRQRLAEVMAASKAREQ